MPFSIVSRMFPEHQGVLSLVNEIAGHCRDNDIKVDISESPWVETGDGTQCSGYFDTCDVVLAVAVGKPCSQWLPILMHEYGHSRQYIFNHELLNEGSDVEDRLFRWAKGEETLSHRTVMRLLNLSTRIERECEKLVLDLIAKHGLQDLVDPQVYAQKANAYLYFWRYFISTKKWYDPLMPPYEIEGIWRSLPTTVLDSHSRMPKHIEALYKQHCRMNG